MMQNIDLKKLERKAWTTYFQDGLIDIVFGFILLVSILSSTLSAMGVPDVVRISIYVPLMFLCPVIYVAGKKYVTIPRLGLVKFGSERKARSKKMILGLIITQLVLLTILILTFLKAVALGFLGSVIVTLNILVALSLLAYYLDYPRMYIIAVLFAMSEPTYYYLQHYTNVTYIGMIAYGVPASIILIMGIVVFYRFLRKYPLPAKEEVDAN